MDPRIPVYVRVLPGGARRDQIAGIAGAATGWAVPARLVSGYVPAAGDLVIDDLGVTKTVLSVAYDEPTATYQLTTNTGP